MSAGSTRPLQSSSMPLAQSSAAPGWIGAVRKSVAVVVDRIVAALAGARVDARVGIVAVGAAARRIGIAVAVGVGAARRAAGEVRGVDEAVAVVVDAVGAVLRRAW